MLNQVKTVEVYSAVLHQKTVIPVKVQINKSSRSLPRVVLVGLAGKTVQESKDRVLSALRASGATWKPGKFTINLQPVNVPKQASSLDLAMALAFLQVNQDLPLNKYAAIGELGLDGSVQAVDHVLSLTYQLMSSHKRVFVPAAQKEELAQLPECERLTPVDNLSEVIAIARGGKRESKIARQAGAEKQNSYPAGLQISKSLLPVLALALAGNHHSLLFGSPGIGKTFIQDIALSLLPPLSVEKELEYLVSNDLMESGQFQQLLVPSSNITRTQLVGGYQPFKPGELARINDGILFLDELPHFSSDTLRAISSTLETQKIVDPSSSKNWSCSYVCLATANPCPCGYFGLPRCGCSVNQVQRYVRNISGALLDRFAIIWRVTDQDMIPFSQKIWQEYAQKIKKAVDRQQTRFQQGYPAKNQFYQLAQIKKLVGQAIMAPTKKDRPHLRQWLNTWRLAITLADLEPTKNISLDHYEQALSYSNQNQWPG